MKLNEQDLPRAEFDGRGKALLRRLSAKTEEPLDYDNPLGALTTASTSHTSFSPVEFSFFASPEPLSPNLGTAHSANSAGHETGRFFSRVGQEIGVQGEAHDEFIRVSEAIQHTPTFCDCASLTFVADCVFDWLHAKDAGLTVKTLTQYVLDRAEDTVCERAVAVPVAMTVVEVPLSLGRVTLQPFSLDLMQSYAEQWRVAQDETKAEEGLPTGSYDAERFFAFLGRAASSSSLAVVTVVGEPRMAVRRALEETERSLAMLRFFAPANLMPGVPCHTVPLGRENLQQRSFLITCEDRLTHGGTVEDHWRAQVAFISAREAVNMQKAGLKTLSRLLAAPTLTPYQDELISTLTLYGRAPLAENITDKLLFTMVALETFLLRDNGESIQKNVGERMAMVVGSSVEERRAIISNLRRAYGMRSSFVHHGKRFDPSQQEPLLHFMHNAWRLFQECIATADEFDTREAFLEAVDEMKFY